MPDAFNSQHSMLRSRSLPIAVVVLALGILGATIFLASNDLRRKSRAQLLKQNAQILYALWSSQEFTGEAEGQFGISERASDQLWSVLQTARTTERAGLLADLLGTRLFDAQGNLAFVDPHLADAALTAEDLRLMEQLKPVAHFYPSTTISEVNLADPAMPPPKGPVLEINIPLHGREHPQLLGIAQFLLDGHKIAEELSTLDRNLILQAFATFAVGGGLLLLLLGLGFRQLLRVNLLLADRSQRLLRANQELALAAKTSAVGAVTAHLIHGLKNPLSGLQNFVASRGGGGSGPEEDSDWELALSSTRRMQTMISEIVRVLQDEHGQSSYELTLQELTDLLAGKVTPLARTAEVDFRCTASGETALSNREANLISLILYNLIQNGIQATPPGKAVTLDVRSTDDDRIVCEVTDEGSGIPPEKQKLLFKPCQSTKEGGSGIGLAISKQLAVCLDASLVLKASSSTGSVFELSFAARSQAPGLISAPSNGQTV